MYFYYLQFVFILYCKVFKSVSHNCFIEWPCNLSITIVFKLMNQGWDYNKTFWVWVWVWLANTKSHYYNLILKWTLKFRICSCLLVIRIYTRPTLHLLIHTAFITHVSPSYSSPYNIVSLYVQCTSLLQAAHSVLYMYMVHSVCVMVLETSLLLKEVLMGPGFIIIYFFYIINYTPFFCCWGRGSRDLFVCWIF